MRTYLTALVTAATLALAPACSKEVDGYSVPPQLNTDAKGMVMNPTGSEKVIEEQEEPSLEELEERLGVPPMGKVIVVPVAGNPSFAPPPLSPSPSSFYPNPIPPLSSLLSNPYSPHSLLSPTQLSSEISLMQQAGIKVDYKVSTIPNSDGFVEALKVETNYFSMLLSFNVELKYLDKEENPLFTVNEDKIIFDPLDSYRLFEFLPSSLGCDRDYDSVAMTVKFLGSEEEPLTTRLDKDSFDKICQDRYKTTNFSTLLGP